MQCIVIAFLAFFAWCLQSLPFSIRNAKRLQKKSTQQYGEFSSLMLTLAHIAYYFCALYEAYARSAAFNTILGV